MRVLVAVLLVAALSACGSAIESADEGHVSIRFHNYVDSPDSLQPIADKQCGEYNRVAVYQTTTMGSGVIGFLTGLPLHAEFACSAPTKS